MTLRRQHEFHRWIYVFRGGTRDFLCAQDQGKFWEMYDTMFAEQNALGVDALKENAKRLGLDTAIFDECLDSGKSEQAIQVDARAAEALGITGTPASFINGRLVNGTASVDQLSRIIDDELRRAVLTARR
jgi:protein-disulfide isomerase